MSFKEGDCIGVYRLLTCCGSGAYGNVFYAENMMTHHHVALKILNSSATANDRELRALSNYKNCRHPNLLQIHHIDKINGKIYYTMDAADNVGTKEHYIPDTLSHRLATRKTLSVDEILKMINELLDGLACLHKHGLIHRDIKPDNILWINGTATLADIGLVTLQGTSSLVGTPGFMSEELLHGKRNASPEDDLYSLGKVIYCALTGCSPEEYPHYPSDVTISNAGPIIHAYTTVCKMPSPIKTSEEMKNILNTFSSREENREYGKSMKKILFFVLLLVFICGLCLCYFQIPWDTSENLGKFNRDVPFKKVIFEEKEDSFSSHAKIESELDLIYEHRDSPFFRQELSLAEAAMQALDATIGEKMRILNSKRLEKNAYSLAKNAIFQARREHLSKDPLCKLVVQEKEIQTFLKQQTARKNSEQQIQKLKLMLDRREEILQELYQKSIRK